jgi:hypothetical protein
MSNEDVNPFDVGLEEEAKVSDETRHVSVSGLGNTDRRSVQGEDILELEDVDPALNMKMHLVNDVGAGAHPIHFSWPVS